MWDKNEPPKYLLLTLYKNETFTVDFFDKEKSADGWMETAKKNADVEIVAIYTPNKFALVKENENEE